MKINKIKLIIIICLTLLTFEGKAFGPPNGGGPGGGAPPGYCDQNPGDPSCGTSVPVGSDVATTFLFLFAIGLGYYTIRNKKLKA